jgi:UDP-N-acetyl-2-amino-2-deoxyglucuronate dehydrogenase
MPAVSRPRGVPVLSAVPGRRPLRVGIVGTGGIARTHATAIAALAAAGDPVTIAAVADVLPERARAFAAERGVPHHFASAEALLGAGLVDCVHVTTPHPAHCAVVVAAAAAGVHALVEKPLAIDLREADRAVEAARRAGTVLSTVFQRRWFPAARRLRRAIDEGKLGRPILGSLEVRWLRTAEYYARDPWRGKWATEGGGCLVNQAVHAIDWLLWYLGPVDVVFGLYHNLGHRDMRLEVDDNAVAAIRFRSGAIATLSASVSVKPASVARVTVHGDNGASASVCEVTEWGGDYVNDIWTIPGEEGLPAAWAAADRAEAWPNWRYHLRQIEDFYAAVRTGRAPEVSGEDGRNAVELIQAIYSASESGLAVAFPMDRRLRHHGLPPDPGPLA